MKFIRFNKRLYFWIIISFITFQLSDGSIISNKLIESPIYFLDEKIQSFSHTFCNDSKIFVIGEDRLNSYLYKFDANLNLIEKKIIGKRLYRTKLNKYSNYILFSGITNQSDSLYYKIDYLKNSIDTLYCFVGNDLKIDNPQSKLFTSVNEKSDKRSLLQVTDKSKKIKCEIDLDFSYWKNDFIKISDSVHLISGKGTIFPMWHQYSFGLLIFVEDEDACINLYSDDSNASIIENAYIKKDTVAVKKLFEEWYSKSVPSNQNSNTEYSKESYTIFQQVYGSLIKPPISASTEKPVYNPEYHIIQSTIQIEVTDSINLPLDSKILTRRNKMHKPGKIETIKSFKPKLSINKKVIYLNAEIVKSLLIFLSNYDGEKQELSKRRDFLIKYVKIYGHHWGAAPHINSQPYISKIVFDDTLKNSIISYRYGYSFYSKLYKKEADKWYFVRILSTGIE